MITIKLDDGGELSIYVEERIYSLDEAYAIAALINEAGAAAEKFIVKERELAPGKIDNGDQDEDD